MNAFSNEKLQLSIITDNLKSFTVASDGGTNDTHYELQIEHKDAGLANFYTATLPDFGAAPPTKGSIAFKDGTDTVTPKEWTFHNVEVSGADIIQFDNTTKITSSIDVLGTDDIIINDFLNLTSWFEVTSTYVDADIQVSYSTTTAGAGNTEFNIGYLAP